MKTWLKIEGRGETIQRSFRVCFNRPYAMLSMAHWWDTVTPVVGGVSSNLASLVTYCSTSSELIQCSAGWASVMHSSQLFGRLSEFITHFHFRWFLAHPFCCPATRKIICAWLPDGVDLTMSSLVPTNHNSSSPPGRQFCFLKPTGRWIVYRLKHSNYSVETAYCWKYNAFIALHKENWLGPTLSLHSLCSWSARLTAWGDRVPSAIAPLKTPSKYRSFEMSISKKKAESTTYR